MARSHLVIQPSPKFAMVERAAHEWRMMRDS